MERMTRKRLAELERPGDALMDSTNNKRAKRSRGGAPAAEASSAVVQVPASEPSIDEDEPEGMTEAEGLTYDLGVVLATVSADRRVIAALQTLEGVPMPGLAIVGAGGVGLALSTRDADAIKACASDARARQARRKLFRPMYSSI